MTIRLPDDLENAIRPLVLSGRYASEDALVAQAVREFLQRRDPGQAPETEVGTPRRPIWDLIEEENQALPPEVWDALPSDLSEQHDHYVYGTPKRPDA